MNNRYNDKDGQLDIKPVNIEMVDQSLVDYFDKRLKLFVQANSRRKRKNKSFICIGRKSFYGKKIRV